MVEATLTKTESKELWQRIEAGMKMKIWFVKKSTEGDREEQLEAFRKYFTLTDIVEADWIYCASVKRVDLAMEGKLATRKPLAVYCWDYYSWAHEGRHHTNEYDWNKYAELLKMAQIVFVPSTAQQKQLRHLLGIDSIVVHSGIKKLNLETSDENFILDPMRYYPEENKTWAEDAAEVLGIPIIHSEHKYSDEEFKKLIATCSFMTCAYREASTGGLTLMEGLSLGKVSLVSNSYYMGAHDYLGPLGCYFQFDDFDHLKRRMEYLWFKRPTIDKRIAEKHLLHYTFDGMAKQIYESLHRYK